MFNYEDNKDYINAELEIKATNTMVFVGLLKASLEYIQAKTVKISQALMLYEKKDEKKENTIENGVANEKEKFKNYTNNALLLDVLQMLSKLLSFNIFKISKQEDAFITLFPNLISLLEFDFSNPLISLAIVNKRQKLYNKLLEQEDTKKNLLATGLSGMKNFFSGVVENVTGLAGEVAGKLIGDESLHGRQKKKKANQFLEGYKETFLYSNPLMRSCISQTNKLGLLSGDDEGKLYKVERDLKILICDLMKQFISMRHDFLITNFIAWYQSLIKFDKEPMSHEKVLNEINDSFMTVLPEILKVGIELVDFKYQIKEEENVLNNVGNKMKNLVGNLGNLIMQEEEEEQIPYLKKKFKVYTNERQLKDLDGLLTGMISDENHNISKTLYPSLIMTFYTNQDQTLECKLLEIIMLCFHQRVKFAQSLKNLELLFDKADIENFMHISKNVREMQSICEKTEVWIFEWHNSKKVPQDLHNLKKIVSFLIFAFHSKSMESKLEIEEIDQDPKEDDEDELLLINPVRQKISYFLGIHQIFIDFLKDTVHLTEKILKDDMIELRDKELFLSLYKKVFIWLKYFVKDNSHNQEVLHESLSQFFFYMEFDLGQCNLICEIFRNNQGLCENIKNTVIYEFLSLIHTIGRRENFLSLFEIVQSVNNTHIFECQAKIINAFLGNTQTAKNFDKLGHLLYMKERDNVLSFDFDIKPLNYYFSQQKNNNSYKTQFNENLYGDKPYKYHAKLLKVLSLAGQGSQGSNLSNARLRKLFDLNEIFFILSDNDTLTTSQLKVKSKTSWEDIRESKGKSGFNIIEVKEDEESSSPFSKKFSTSIKRTRTLSKLNPLDNKDKNIGTNTLKPALLQYLIDVYLPTMKKEKDEFQSVSNSIQLFFMKEYDRLKDISNQDVKSEAFKDYFFQKVLKFTNSYIKEIITPVFTENSERKDNETLNEWLEIILGRLDAIDNSLTNVQFDNLVEFVKYFRNLSEGDELSIRLEKCIEEDEKKINKVGSQSNMSIMTEVFEEGLDTPAGWKAFVKLCLSSDVLEKVYIRVFY